MDSDRRSSRSRSFSSSSASLPSSPCFCASPSSPGRGIATDEILRNSLDLRKETEMARAGKPNILVLWGDDIGWWNISYNNRGQMGYRTPNIERIGHEGATFTAYYGQQSCPA